MQSTGDKIRETKSGGQSQDGREGNRCKGVQCGLIMSSKKKKKPSSLLTLDAKLSLEGKSVEELSCSESNEAVPIKLDF